MPSVRLISNTSRHWLRVFLPFAAGYYLAYLLRNANAVLAPELTRELGLTAADLGLLTSVYFLAFGAFQVPLGILLDRFGPRRAEATLLLFAGAGTLVFALGRDIAELAAGRALIGLGVSACLMGALKNFSQWYPIERQSSFTGAIMVSGSLGAITASVPLEAMLPLLGWRGVFLLLTAVLLGAAAYLYLAVPDRAEGVAQTRLGEQWRGVAHVFASRDFWRFAPLMTLFAGGFMAVAGLWIVPWFIEVDGLTRETAARHLFAIGVAQLAGFFAIAAFATPMIRRGVKPPCRCPSGAPVMAALQLLRRRRDARICRARSAFRSRALRPPQHGAQLAGIRRRLFTAMGNRSARRPVRSRLVVPGQRLSRRVRRPGGNAVARLELVRPRGPSRGGAPRRVRNRAAGAVIRRKPCAAN